MNSKQDEEDHTNKFVGIPKSYMKTKMRFNLIFSICLIVIALVLISTIPGMYKQSYDRGYLEGSTNNLGDNETCVISEINDSVNLSNIYENMTGVNFYNYQVKLLDEFDRPIEDIDCDLFIVEIAEPSSNERTEYKEIDKSISNLKGDCIFKSIPAKSKCINISVVLEKAGIPGIIPTELCGNKTEEYYVSKEEGLSYKYILDTELKGGGWLE